MYKYFFRNKSEDFKKWVKLFNFFIPLLITLIFSIWGIIISIKGYDLNVEIKNNREQIDSIVIVIKELRKQNTLLKSQIEQTSRLIDINKYSSEIQNKQFNATIEDYRKSKTPKMVINVIKDESYQITDFANVPREHKIVVRITNLGGDIYNLECNTVVGMYIDSGYFPKNGIFPRNSYFDIPFIDLKKNLYKVRFQFSDELKRCYFQDLVWKAKNDTYDFQFDKMINCK